MSIQIGYNHSDCCVVRLQILFLIQVHCQNQGTVNQLNEASLVDSALVVTEAITLKG